MFSAEQSHIGAYFKHFSPCSSMHVSSIEIGGGLIIVSPREMVFNEVLNNKVG